MQVAVLSLPALRPRLQEILWLLESLNSSAWATDASVTNESAAPQQIFATKFIRIIPVTCFANFVSRPKRQDSREARNWKSQCLKSKATAPWRMVASY